MSAERRDPVVRPPSAALRERIRAAALGLGFDQVGFAPAERPGHAEAYLRWLAGGRHGEMAYMAREDAVRRRLDPAEALPGCRTLIVVSLVYGPGADERRTRPTPRAIVARYASGRDYHDVFEEKLEALAERTAALAPEARCKRYVDYGPVLEREHAQRAGLGWIGKNTMLIHPRLGSYLMLGELLTTLELPPDEPFTADRCGTCRRCIEACPTDAIRGPRELDARRCISYLTIELRGPIPIELRPLIGDRVFGCDICQEVCPWNEDAPTPEASPFPVEPGRPVPPATMLAWAEELLGICEEEFRARYRGSALSRPGRAGLLRNLCVGLGNWGSERGVPVLVRALEDDHPLVRGHAAWALGRMATSDARRALARRLESERDDRVREELEVALLS
ncbi:MAG: tRNA epoxyqueuosine(34) reductase QueG [Gemmatimonadota bacterium]